MSQLSSQPSQPDWSDSTTLQQTTTSDAPTAVAGRGGSRDDGEDRLWGFSPGSCSWCSTA